MLAGLVVQLAKCYMIEVEAEDDRNVTYSDLQARVTIPIITLKASADQDQTQNCPNQRPKKSKNLTPVPL